MVRDEEQLLYPSPVGPWHSACRDKKHGASVSVWLTNTIIKQLNTHVITCHLEPSPPRPTQKSVGLRNIGNARTV